MSNQIDETAYYVDDEGKSLWGQSQEVIRARHAKLDALRAKLDAIRRATTEPVEDEL